MRTICFLAMICLLFGCAKQNTYDKVWSNYDWLPPGTENSNPYVVQQPGSYYRGYPQVYDNDTDYVQPYGWGMCNGVNSLGTCE